MRPDSLLGMTFDEYRVEKPLGAGGMAKVYRALDVKLNRYVALKVIAADHREDTAYRERFEREAQSIARLEHPHIIQIHRFGEANGMYYMVMQYVNGADLHWLIQDYKSTGEVMPIGDIIRVVREIGTALDYAHGRDVIHRDVKPSNILVDNRGRAMLTDFGLALIADVGTQGEIFGSPQYNAPEQVVSSANVVPQSDIYSLGITLFEMLTGEVPFTADDPMELSMRHLSDPPPAPSQFNPAVPGAVDEIVLRALDKDPFKRYLTCLEFSDALEAAVETSWSNAPPASASSRRPSLVLLPQKVHSYLQTPLVPSADTASTANPVSNAPPTTLVRKNAPPTSSWKRALAFAGFLFLIGLAFIFILLKLHNSTGTQTAETMPPSAPATVGVPIVQAIASPTPMPTPTMTAISLPFVQPMPPNPTPIPVTFVPIVIQPTIAIPATSAPITIPSTPTTPVIFVPLVVQPTPITPTLTDVANQYVLLFTRNKDQSLFIVNIGPGSFPLNGLSVGNNRGGVDGAEWQLDQLENGSCVSIWKSGGHVSKPDVSCSEVGARLTRGAHDVFWKSSFSVYYNDLSVATCDQDTCLVQVSIH